MIFSECSECHYAKLILHIVIRVLSWFACMAILSPIVASTKN